MACTQALAITALTSLVFVPVLSAQGISWDIPVRGALEFDRTEEVLRIDPPAERARTLDLIPSAEQGGHTWRYLRCAAGAAPPLWNARAFDDSEWPEGRSMFGGDNANNPLHRTPWNTTAICIRTEVEMGRRRPKAAVFRIHHDDGIRVYWNGVEVVTNDGHGMDRLYTVTGQQLDCWRRGDNLVAVSGSNIGGAQYLDVGLTFFYQWPPGVRDAQALIKYLRDRQGSAQRLRGDLFPSFRTPALLLEGELDADKERVQRSPADLRDLGWFVATDLSRGVTSHNMNRDVVRMFLFGDLGIRGRVASVDVDGWQTLSLDVRTAEEPAPRGDDKRYIASYVKPHGGTVFTGKLDVRRRVEVRGRKARVVEFESRLTGTAARGDTQHPLEHRERWKLRSVRDNQDARFRKDVLDAIAKGCDSLRRQLGNLNKPELGPSKKDSNRSYPTGRLALALLAMIKGGIPKDDEVLQRALTELKKRHIVDTYSLGNALMALEGYYAPNGEYDDLRTGVIERLRKRRLPPADLEIMTEWTAQLLDNIDTRVDEAYLLRFNYVRGGRYDNSVNQYGLLGLYSAHLAGVPISPQVWEAAANHLLLVQGEPEQRVALELVDYRTHSRMSTDPDARRTVSRLPIRAAGWNYTEPKWNSIATPKYGSMTCAGITGLTMCLAALQDYDLKRVKLVHDATRARDRGFAWLALHLQTRYHPGWIARQQRWIYYYLYSLERACLLSGVALIQDRDWYYEGSMVLMALQHADGSWPGEYGADHVIERTAMAVLFLKKASLPVYTGR